MMNVFDKKGNVNAYPFARTEKKKVEIPQPLKISRDRRERVERDINSAMFAYFNAYKEISRLNPEDFYNKKQKLSSEAKKIATLLGEVRDTFSKWYESLIGLTEHKEVSEYLDYNYICSSFLIDKMRSFTEEEVKPLVKGVYQQRKAATLAQFVIAKRLVRMAMHISDVVCREYKLAMPDLSKFLWQDKIDQAFINMEVAFDNLIKVGDLDVNKVYENTGATYNLSRLITDPSYFPKIQKAYNS